MANGMAKVDEVSKTCLALIHSDDVGLDRNRADYDGKEKLLSSRASAQNPSRVVLGWRLNCGEDLC